MELLVTRALRFSEARSFKKSHLLLCVPYVYSALRNVEARQDTRAHVYS